MHSMRTITIIAVLLAGTVPASALCVSVPDDQSSAYVRNGLKQTICLDNELNAATQQRKLETELRTTLDRLERQSIQQKFDVPVIRPIDPFAPRWP